MRHTGHPLTMAGRALAALLVLGGCRDDRSDPAGPPEPETGDPAIYAPDGWPLKIGDRISSAELDRLFDEFELPGLPRTWGEAGHTPRSSYIDPSDHYSSPWRNYVALNLVGDGVYAALIDYDPTKLGDYDLVYLGHFRIRFSERRRFAESDLPPEFRGRVEYYTPPPPPPPDPNKSLTVVIDRTVWDADGRRLKLNSDWVMLPPDRLKWPDYRERRK